MKYYLYIAFSYFNLIVPVLVDLDICLTSSQGELLFDESFPCWYGLFHGKVWSTGNISIVEPCVWKNCGIEWSSHCYSSEKDDCKAYHQKLSHVGNSKFEVTKYDLV